MWTSTVTTTAIPFCLPEMSLYLLLLQFFCRDNVFLKMFFIILYSFYLFIFFHSKPCYFLFIACMDRKEITATSNSWNVNMSMWIRQIEKNVNLSVVGFCTDLTTPNTRWWKLLCCSVGLGYYVNAPYMWAANISLTCDFSADGWSVPGGSDSEYHFLANVHGEGLSWAIHDVQRYRAQHRHIHRWRVKAL